MKTFTRIVGIITVSTLMVCIPVAYGGTTVAKETDFIYELNEAGDVVILTGYQKDATGGDVIIPSTIEGYPVVAIRADEFVAGTSFFCEMLTYMNKTDAEIKAAGLHPRITSVVFPDSITEMSLGEYSSGIAYGCEALESITLPKNLREIPANFATSCENLTTVVWPEKLEIIGSSVFQFTGLTEVVIPEGVKEIWNDAFSNCEKLTSVTIPASVGKIGSAFHSNPELAVVNMPAKTIQYGSRDNNLDVTWNFFGGDDYWQMTFNFTPKLTGIAVRKAIQDTKASFNSNN